MRLFSAIRSDAGYSLLELLIVLGIFALAAAVAMPRITNVRPSTAGRITERTLIDELQRVRAEAIRSNEVHWLEIAADGGSLETSTGRRIRMASGVRIVPAALRRIVRFYPDGRSSGADWRLSDGASSAAVSVDWLTGQVRIEKGSLP